MKDLNIGIIGTGFGKMIGLNFKAVEPSVKIFFYGRDKEKLNKAVAEVKADGTYAAWEELVKDPKIDLVVIASPSGMHKEMFVLAARENKDILVEKPAALNSKDIDDMAKSFENKDKLAVVNHEGRFHPVILYIKQLITGGKLGDIMTLRSGAYLNWYSNPDYKENWNNDKNLGGGQIFSIGTHQMDLARYLLGFPEVTSGSVQNIVYPDKRFIKKPSAESQFSAHFETREGTSIQLYNDTYCFGYKDFILEVIGSKGIVIYSDQRGLKESFYNSEPLKDVVWSDPMPQIPLGNSILSKSMKYMAKELMESIGTGKNNETFCTLEQEKENLEIFEKFMN
jgi:predicted dehydrogenase